MQCKISIWLDAKVDFDFNDIEDILIADRSVVAGDNFFTVQIPADALAGSPSYCRIRLSYGPTVPTISYRVGLVNGEMEDYRVDILDFYSATPTATATMTPTFTSIP